MRVCVCVCVCVCVMQLEENINLVMCLAHDILANVERNTLRNLIRLFIISHSANNQFFSLQL